ncbi:MAG: glycine betaine/L-proline ABC transporter ATP-binding protein ProV [Desulfuromonadaceae bacterium]|nr:glycine betaine/L-proline ABC transporter ATP-binding protein ProV [Desulfuromonadaceae bacterium]
MESKAKITVEGVYKIFGSQPHKALAMLSSGQDKSRVFEKTGMTVGVCDASFTINEGEIFVIMGLSGSGKSTMVRLLNRLIEPSAGTIAIDGQEITGLSDKGLIELRRKKISMVFQSFALMPHLTILQNACFGLELAGCDREQGKKQALDALQRVGLETWADSYPKELSGGMQQRVGLARALAVNPEILLMDEAFSALDPLIRAEMQDELIKLQAQDQRTIVFISHDLDEAIRIGDRIAIMHDGRVVQVGTPEEILQNPANDYVQNFFRGVDPTQIISAGDMARKTQVTLIRHPGDGPRAGLQRLINHDRNYGYVLDKNGHYLGVVSDETLQNTLNQKIDDLTQAFLPDADAVRATDSMQDILPAITAHPWPVPVIDDNDKYRGVISRNLFLRTLQRTHEESSTEVLASVSQNEKEG